MSSGCDECFWIPISLDRNSRYLLAEDNANYLLQAIICSPKLSVITCEISPWFISFALVVCHYWQEMPWIIL